MDSAMCGDVGGVGLIVSGKKLLFVTLVWTSIVTGQLASAATEAPSDVTTALTASLDDVTTFPNDVTTSLDDVATSLNDVTASTASLSDVTSPTASLTDVNITAQNVTDDAETVAEATGRGEGCVNASVPCADTTTMEITTTQELPTTQIGDTAATLSASSSESNDSAITSTTASDTEVTSDLSLTTVPVLYTGSSQNGTFSSDSTEPSVPETTPMADQSTSDSMLSTVNTTTDVVSDFPDSHTVTVATPSSSGNVSDWLANLPVIVNDTLGANASVLIGANGTSFMGTISSEGDAALDMNGTATPGVSGFNLSTDLNATGTDADQLATPPNTTDVSNATDLPSSLNATDMSALFPTGINDSMTSSFETGQPLTDSTTTAESTTADFVDPFSFHIDPPKDPNTPPPQATTTPASTGVVDTGHTTVEEDPSGLAAWWPVVGGDSAQPKNTTESNGTAPEPVVPQDPAADINGTFPLPDLTSSFSATTPTPLVTTTVPQLSFENATDNLILPDESKNVEMLGSVEGAGQEPLLPSVDANVEPVSQVTPSFQPDPPPAMEPNLILEPEGVENPKPIVEPETPVRKPEKPGLEPDVPAGIPDSSWWPGGEGKEEEKRGTTSSGHGGPDLLDKFQMVFLVAPCVGAMLAVIGAACALRCATANCRKRRKLNRKLKKQQKEEEQKRKEEEKKRQEEKKKEKEKKKSGAKQAEVTEENETEQKGHRKRKHHHHREQNGHAPSEEPEHKGGKKSHK